MTPLVDELIPCPDPWDVARTLAHLPHLLFLDSADRSTERGRYSYVAADPALFVTLPYTNWYRYDMFTLAAQWMPRVRATPADLPFVGGMVGMFGYGMLHGTE